MGCTQGSKKAANAPTPVTSKAAKAAKAYIDLTGSYAQSLAPGMETLTQSGCSGRALGGWTYTVSGSTATIHGHGVTGQVTGKAGSYRIAWSNGNIYTQAVNEAKVKQEHPKLGIIRMDYQYEVPIGDVDSPASFGYQVHYRAVPGMDWDVLMSGKMSPEVKKNLKAAIKELEEFGVCAITGDCGLMYAFQKEIRLATRLPVLMSSFFQLPFVQTLVSPDEQVLVLSAMGWNGDAGKSVDKVLTGSGFQADKTRFIFEGFSDLPGLETVPQGGTFVYKKVAPALVQRIKGLIRKNPGIRSIVFECTELPPYSDLVRYETGLPVYDAITMCDFFMSSRLDNPYDQYGNWLKEPRMQKEQYYFGAHLDEDEKKQVLSPAPPAEYADATLGMPHAHPEVKKAAPVLGVICFDGAQDTTYRGSFDFKIHTKAVPGLTLEMCKGDELSADVRSAFEVALKQLESEGVGAITGDSSLLVKFQDIALGVVKVPVCLSPILMYPMLQACFDDHEKVLIVTADASSMAPMSVIFEKCKLPEPKNKKFEIVGVAEMGLPEADAIKGGTLLQAPEPFGAALVAGLKKRMQKDKDLRAVLLESEKLAPFADLLRHQLKIPVFDAVNLCNYVMSSVKDNPRFGINYQC